MCLPAKARDPFPIVNASFDGFEPRAAGPLQCVLHRLPEARELGEIRRVTRSVPLSSRVNLTGYAITWGLVSAFAEGPVVRGAVRTPLPLARVGVGVSG